MADTGVVAEISWRVTGCVAGAAAPCCPDPDEEAGENTPARHAHTAPAASAITTPRATHRPGWRDWIASETAVTSSSCSASRPRGTVAFMTRLLVPGSSVFSLRLIDVLLQARAESPAFADRAFHVEL
jgi:hypothetical protein